MYRTIVERKLRRAFADLNAGRYDRIVPPVRSLAPSVFFGDHALGGESARTSRPITGGT